MGTDFIDISLDTRQQVEGCDGMASSMHSLHVLAMVSVVRHGSSNLDLIFMCKRPSYPPTLQWSVSTCNTVPQKSTSNWTPAQPAWNQDSE